MTPSRKKTRNILKPLAVATLMAGGLLQPFMLPAFAAAGDTISNTATATYEDETGTSFETESNTVEIQITEVAGITVEGTGVDDLNGGSFEANDVLDFNFTITNVGNDTTDVQIPGLDDLITQNFTPTQIEVFTAGGASIGTITGNDPMQLVADLGGAPLAAGESVTVVVTGTVPNGGLNPGDDISVTLGNTTPNDNTPDTQNQDADTNDSNVATVDLPDATDETAGAVAQEKEASATLSVDFATEQKPLALITVEKTTSSVDPGATGAANDDVITYDLSLTVENTSPNGSFIPEALDKTPIMLNTGAGAVSTPAVLISDVIPEFTEFTGTVSAPAGWDVVYSSDDPETTSPVIASGATAAQWTTTAPATPAEIAAVRRIGFIYTGVPPLPANGTAISGYQFDVITSGLPAAGGSIYNLAQAFGTTYDDPANSNDPIDQIVYDESGDDNPNNFNDDSTPPEETDGGNPDGSDFNPTEDTGVADPSNHGTDDGTNTGTGPEGEDNQVDLTGEELSGDDNILNGPDDSPDAVGPNDDDDDYTNKGIDIDDIATETVDFVNTVANPATNTSQIDNVTIEPIAPTDAEANDESAVTGQYGTNADIPNGTEVTITYDPTPGAPTSGDEVSATYTWNDTTNTWDTTDTPINVGTLQPGESVDYEVEVDFSGATPSEFDVVPVTIVAFPDTGAPGYDSETVNNMTIDRTYLGFVEIMKEARILDADGTVLEDWTQSPTQTANSGSIVEYRITYENVSPPVTGSGNVGLTATNVQIIEDGDQVYGTVDSDPYNAATDGGRDNTWHSDTSPLTVHLNGTSQSAGSVRYYTEFTDDNVANDTMIGTTDPADGAVVEAYVNEVGNVVPGGTGTLIIRREVQ